MAPTWVTEKAVRHVHEELLSEHGGLRGPSRSGTLEAALARPIHLHRYAKSPPSLARLAATYGYALARGHCFPDGNKRLGLAVIDIFLQLNGHELTAGEADVVVTITALANGQMDEEGLAQWIETNCSAMPE